ncbi:MAG: SBBP repeat-containing protein [Chitinophagaceae bacterium]|nr:SBBP repeat-containing protein [Chitinophagaceae bacterium]
MKRAITIFILSFCFLTAKSQIPPFSWAVTFGSTGNDYCTSIAFDNTGNSATVGDFGGTIDFDPGPAVHNFTSNGHFDFFVLKLDAGGNYLWAATFGADRTDQASAVRFDNAGNVYVTGNFDNTVDFDPGPGVYNMTGPGIFLLKLDANGNFIWVKNFSGIQFNTIATDAAGSLYATGAFYQISDFDPGPGVFNLTEYGYTGSSSTTTDGFVLKLDATGNFQWAKQLGGSGNDGGSGIALDPNGNILTTGFFAATADFDPGPATANLICNGYIDVYISKLDPSGNFIWCKGMGSTLEDKGMDIATDASGNIYVGGAFVTTADFDPGAGTFNMTSAGGFDLFILKLNDQGNFIWAKRAGGTATDFCRRIAVDNFGSVYFTGWFEGTGDYDPGPGTYMLTSLGSYDVFSEKLDPNGNFSWAFAMGGSINVDMGYDINVDQLGNVYTVGFFWGTVDFDPGPGSFIRTMVDYGDAFIQKLNRCSNITYSTISDTACYTYTLNNQTYTTSGIYTQVLPNTSGCDSIITLNLLIGGYTLTSTVAACDSYTWQYQTYTTSGAYSVTYTDRFGCDSTLNLNLTINHPVYSTVNAAICEGQVYAGHTTSGTYLDTYTATNGCDSIRTLHLTVNPKVYSTINAIICEGQNYAGYTSSGIFTDTYTASNGCDSIRTLLLQVNSRSYSSKNISICEGEFYYVQHANQTTTGIYRDTLINSLGCDSVITTNLIVNPKPVPNLGEDRSICSNAALTLNPGIFSSYEWQDMSSNAVFSVNSIGKYWVTVKNNFNCSASDTINILSINNPPVDFLKETDSICTGKNLMIKPASTFNSYLWSTGTSQNNILIYDAGKYWLGVTDINGCFGSDTITIIAKNCLTEVYFPNAFTPDGDGKNDYFKATFYGNLIRFNLQVFNRYGHIVFQSTDPQKSWNGSYRGARSGTEVFTWRCVYQLEGKLLTYEKGTVLSIR